MVGPISTVNSGCVADVVVGDPMLASTRKNLHDDNPSCRVVTV